MYIVNTQPRGIHAQFKRSPCTVSAETMHKTNGLCALTERNMQFSILVIRNNLTTIGFVPQWLFNY